MEGELEREELEVEGLLKRLFRGMDVEVVEGLEEEGGVDRRVTLEAEAQRLAREHGRCRAAYLLEGYGGGWNARGRYAEAAERPTPRL